MSERTYKDYCRKGDVNANAVMKWFLVAASGLNFSLVIMGPGVLLRVVSVLVAGVMTLLAYASDQAAKEARANRERLGL